MQHVADHNLAQPRFRLAGRLTEIQLRSHSLQRGVFSSDYVMRHVPGLCKNREGKICVITITRAHAGALVRHSWNLCFGGKGPDKARP